MGQIVKLLLIVGVLALVIYGIYYMFTCIRLPLRTVNVYTGDLGAGKTFTGTKNPIKERNKSIVKYWIYNKYWYQVFLLELLLMFVALSKLLETNIYISLLYMLLFIAFICYKWFKQRKYRKCYFIRDIYSNYPIYLTTVYMRKKRKESEEDFKKRVENKYKGIEEAVILPKRKKSRTYKIKIYSKALKKGHILGTIRTTPAPIIVCDEASQLFPNNNKKSDIITEEAIRWFRHHTWAPKMGSGSLYFMDQSIGSLDISLRRRIGTVYLLANWKRRFFFFYTMEVDKIKYAEDVIVNTNSINDWTTKHIVGIIGKHRYDSTYHRLFYKPKTDYEAIWKDSLINPNDKNVNDITIGYGSTYNNQKTMKQ